MDALQELQHELGLPLTRKQWLSFVLARLRSWQSFANVARAVNFE
jgi:hypothetical protein